MSTITLTNTFVDAAVIEAEEFNENFTDITDVVNGNLDGDNISTSSALSVATLATSGNAAITGTLAVTGTSTLTGAQTLTGATTCNGGIILAADKGIAHKVLARAYLSADQDNIATSGAGWYKINLNSESYDVGSDFDTSNNCFVVPVTGYYLTCGAIQFEETDMSASAILGAAIYVDPLGAGSPAITQNGQIFVAHADTTTMALSVFGILYLTATDKVYLYGYSSDTNVDIDGGEALTNMSIMLIST